MLAGILWQEPLQRTNTHLDCTFRERTSCPGAQLVSQKRFGCDVCIYYHMVIIHSNSAISGTLLGSPLFEFCFIKHSPRIFLLPQERHIPSTERHNQQRAQGDLAKGKVTQGSHTLLICLTSLGSCLLMDGPPAAWPPLCSPGTQTHESQRDRPPLWALAEQESWTSWGRMCGCPSPASLCPWC